MKNIIILVLFFLSLSLHAQNFPSPYCDIDPTSVEEITAVYFAGTSITNTDATSILVDKTSTIVNLTQDETYTIVVKGDTKGDFDNNVVAFIDWNQNAILDDAGEIYEIGTLSNSTGSDSISVSMDITVPLDAVVGPTRIRITKTYTDEESIAEINPCAIEMDAFGMGIYPGYGQALDFTVNVEGLGVEIFDTNALSVYPIPAMDILNIKYKSELNAVKIFNLLGQEVYTKNTAVSHLQLDVSRLTTGTYIIKLFTQEGQHNFRFLKK